MRKDGRYVDDREYQRRLKNLDNSALRHIIKDAKEAERANPTNPNAGFYLDEVSYAAMELRRRGL